MAMHDDGFPAAGRRGAPGGHGGAGVVFGNASTLDQHKGQRRGPGGAGGAPEGQATAHWVRKVRPLSKHIAPISVYLASI